MVKAFYLSDEQVEKIKAFEDTQDIIVAIEQGLDMPYYGAIGGSLSYIFIPTSLGVIIKVRHSVTKEELDVTEYDLF